MTTPDIYPPISGEAVEAIARLLAHERLLSIGINRPDGWPQVTTVGYINDGLNLYFVTGRESQKLANLQADPRVSIAIHAHGDASGAVGVSMAARAAEVTDAHEVERLNQLMFASWPLISVYCPASSSVAIIQVKPELICAISAFKGRNKTECFSLGDAAMPRSAAPAKRDDAQTASLEARLF